MTARRNSWKVRGGVAIALALALAAPTQAAPPALLAAAEPAPARKLESRPHRVFHFNAGTMQPPSALLVNGEGGLLGAGRLVAHCMLIETNRGLVLVDTGLGTEDVTRPEGRFSWGFFALVRPKLAVEETARHQIERLGYRAEDVTDIVLTHADVDHVGGLADFPKARVHLTARELERVKSGVDRLARVRWTHGPRWVPHTLTKRSWYGFDSAPLLPNLVPEVRIVGLPGHSAGHAGVAVRQGDRWLLHAGDAYYHRGEVEGAVRQCPPALDAMHRVHGGVEFEDFEATQSALRRLLRAKGQPVRIVSAHDPREWAAVTAEGLLPRLAAAGPQVSRQAY